ncbi:hypothetical protein [Burkholderia diffusa]|uniref:hypothetical protein n=1 Tax=Burkholderia diffusa TaxID=488732 RepID=UPI0012D99B9F|nr:hypothetical protein [Burkholderia diffusa]
MGGLGKSLCKTGILTHREAATALAGWTAAQTRDGRGSIASPAPASALAKARRAASLRGDATTAAGTPHARPSHRHDPREHDGHRTGQGCPRPREFMMKNVQQALQIIDLYILNILNEQQLDHELMKLSTNQKLELKLQPKQEVKKIIKI